MSLQSAEVHAYAKLNLSLDVVGKREDGYHTVDMVMQSISLCDTVRVALNNSGEIRLGCSKPHIPLDGSNTAFKAAQFFLDVTGLPFGADIYIEKHIPDQAGMGGGSADAAAVLRAMNGLCAGILGEVPLNTAELLYLGVRIGADVPFCIQNGTRRCEGIGERMTPLAPLEPCFLLIVKPNVQVSTSEAYRLLDRMPDMGVRYTENMVRAVERRTVPEVALCLGNHFDDAMQLPQVQAIKIGMRQSGALNAIMTGSGSAVFGVFTDEKAACAAQEGFAGTFEETFLARPVSAGEAAHGIQVSV